MIEKSFVLAAMSIALLSGCEGHGGSDPGASQPTEASAAASTSEPKAQASSPSTTQAQDGDWFYDKKDDKMRGTSRYVARLESSDSIQQKFPYEGDTHLAVMLRRGADSDNDVMINIDKGQMPCSSVGDCTFRAKFDNGPVETFHAVGPANSTGGSLFISSESGMKKFMSELRKAKSMIIEVDVYEDGTQQFTFKPRGLKWTWF